MPRIGTEMPSLEGATQWFNATGARAAEEAKGHPTLVHFWSVGCNICKDNLRQVAAWRDEFADLRVIAVHTPRNEADADTEKVREAVALHNLTEPCAVDNEHKLREAFQNEGGDVPAYYLYDGEGKLRSFASGERGLSTVGAALEGMLAPGREGKAAS
ncbi:MAG TPA: redoxin domain-containing protein [Pyrinomonadaceae bacterium]|nr:redoxin domain-containing protein [Pyrinomonadaceae bacterium]